MTPNEQKAISLRAAINERAERLREAQGMASLTGMQWAYDDVRSLKAQIRDLELELSKIPL